MRPFKADLHIHTCLSPCSGLDMTPRNIVACAVEKKIDIIGICDHNSTENSRAVVEAARNTGLNVFPGMEVTSREEVHILALFNEGENALRLQDYVYANLPGENDEAIFGQQVIVDEDEIVLGFNERFLIGATVLSLADVLQAIHAFRGIAIASHIDREAFGIVGQLGLVPKDIDLDALEISSRMTFDEAQRKFSLDYPLTCSSDAHGLEEIGQGITLFLLEEGTVEEILMALKSQGGRRLLH
jgi:PHP family Zn ribbon phosphoesterase